MHKEFDHTFLYLAENTIQKDAENHTLECQSWFKHYMNKAFDCVSGRLIQLSGTCFLNSVINGLFLSRGIRHLLKQIYDEEPNKDFVPLQELSCPVEQTKSSKKYILNLIDTLIIKKQTMQGKFDILKSAAQENYYMTEKGGFNFFTLLEILFSLNISFLLKLPDYFKVYDFDNVNQSNYTQFNTLVKPSKEINVKHFAKSGLDEYNYFKTFVLQQTKLSETDLIIDWQPVAVSLSAQHQQFILPEAMTTAEKFKKFENVEFVLQFALINIEFEFSNHGVVGIFCNKKPVIFDSNNHFYDVDWTRFTPGIVNPDHFLEKQLTLIYEEKHGKPLKIKREYTIYMRKNKILELQK